MNIPASHPMDRLAHIPITNIRVVPGFNPRKFFADAAFRELVQSIKSAGVIQPVVVRPGDEEVHVICVETGEVVWRSTEVLPAAGPNDSRRPARLADAKPLRCRKPETLAKILPTGHDRP